MTLTIDNTSNNSQTNSYPYDAYNSYNVTNKTISQVTKDKDSVDKATFLLKIADKSIDMYLPENVSQRKDGLSMLKSVLQKLESCKDDTKAVFLNSKSWGYENLVAAFNKTNITFSENEIARAKDAIAIDENFNLSIKDVNLLLDIINNKLPEESGNTTQSSESSKSSKVDTSTVSLNSNDAFIALILTMMWHLMMAQMDITSKQAIVGAQLANNSLIAAGISAENSMNAAKRSYDSSKHAAECKLISESMKATAGLGTGTLDIIGSFKTINLQTLNAQSNVSTSTDNIARAETLSKISVINARAIEPTDDMLATPENRRIANEMIDGIRNNKSSVYTPDEIGLTTINENTSDIIATGAKLKALSDANPLKNATFAPTTQASIVLDNTAVIIHDNDWIAIKKVVIASVADTRKFNSKLPVASAGKDIGIEAGNAVAEQMRTAGYTATEQAKGFLYMRNMYVNHPEITDNEINNIPKGVFGINSLDTTHWLGLRYTHVFSASDTLKNIVDETNIRDKALFAQAQKGIWFSDKGKDYLYAGTAADVIATFDVFKDGKPMQSVRIGILGSNETPLLDLERATSNDGTRIRGTINRNDIRDVFLEKDPGSIRNQHNPINIMNMNIKALEMNKVTLSPLFGDGHNQSGFNIAIAAQMQQLNSKQMWYRGLGAMFGACGSIASMGPEYIAAKHSALAQQEASAAGALSGEVNAYASLLASMVQTFQSGVLDSNKALQQLLAAGLNAAAKAAAAAGA